MVVLAPVRRGVLRPDVRVRPGAAPERHGRPQLLRHCLPAPRRAGQAGQAWRPVHGPSPQPRHGTWVAGCPRHPSRPHLHAGKPRRALWSEALRTQHESYEQQVVFIACYPFRIVLVSLAQERGCTDKEALQAQGAGTGECCGRGSAVITCCMGGRCWGTP